MPRLALDALPSLVFVGHSKPTLQLRWGAFSVQHVPQKRSLQEQTGPETLVLTLHSCGVVPRARDPWVTVHCVIMHGQREAYSAYEHCSGRHFLDCSP